MRDRPVTLFLSGDVMTGRGIDQILPHPGDPQLFEAWVDSAGTYVRIAERASGPIPRRVGPDYVWGDALAELDRAAADVRIVNLETAVTTSGEAWPGKGIHYRMHPANLPLLRAAKIDCCVLANNHVLDWGRRGLEETVAALEACGIQVAGAGADAGRAAAPAFLPLAQGGRVLVFACATEDSGVPPDWAAWDDRSGIRLLEDLSGRSVEALLSRVRAEARAGDLVVVSIHWGGNWGDRVDSEQRAFAHSLVDGGAVHVVHGHSSHHPRGVEIRRGRLILYGCGDLINDYEGIGGHESYRPELSLMYFPAFDVAAGRLLRLDLAPMRMRRFRLERAGADDARWLADRLTAQGRELGTRARVSEGGRIRVEERERPAVPG